MGKQAILWMVFLLMWGTSCSQNGGAVNGPVVVITTPEGEIRVRLYEETPQHRDNFLKLVREGYYDGVLFHRVIRDFMIQAGDPESRNALPGVPLGNGGPGYTVPAEIVPALFHKRGPWRRPAWATRSTLKKPPADHSFTSWKEKYGDPGNSTPWKTV